MWAKGQGRWACGLARVCWHTGQEACPVSHSGHRLLYEEGNSCQPCFFSLKGKKLNPLELHSYQSWFTLLCSLYPQSPLSPGTGAGGWVASDS